MCGSEATRGLSRKRSSRSASGTTKTSDCKIAVEQNAMSRDVSEASIPTRDLNHWRSSSTREIRAMGVSQTNEASRVRSSKDCSGSVSRMAYFSKAAILPSSLTGLAMTMSHLLRDPLARVGSRPGRNHTPKRRIWRAKRSPCPSDRCKGCWLRQLSGGELLEWRQSRLQYCSTSCTYSLESTRLIRGELWFSNGDGHEDCYACAIYRNCNCSIRKCTCGGTKSNRAREIHAHAGEPRGTHLVPGCQVWNVHSLGCVQRARRWGMDHGDAADQ